MKVLAVHNFYRASAPSGENAVYGNEAEMLRSRGIEVVAYTKDNEILSSFFHRLRVPPRMCWSRESYREIRSLIAREKPDVAHFHNIWYLISPSAYRACRDAGVPVVQTLHNFRMFCMNGAFSRAGRVCEDCLGRSSLPGLVHGCFRNSRLFSLPLAFAQEAHRRIGTWQNGVDRYIALTEFAREKFAEAGLPQERISVKPNFVPDPPAPSSGAGDGVICAGRLSAEKGVSVLIRAFREIAPRHPGLTLRILGDGPLRRDLEAEARGSPIEFLGARPRAEAVRMIGNSKFLVLPSVCYEMFPLSVLEAFACGRAVVAPRFGSSECVVEDGETGLLFEPGNPKDLAVRLDALLRDEGLCARMGENARAEFEAKYTEDRNFGELMAVYRFAADRR